MAATEFKFAKILRLSTTAEADKTRFAFDVADFPNVKVRIAQVKIEKKSNFYVIDPIC